MDAAGGTGRITLPLARMGYSVTLCDISSKEFVRVTKKGGRISIFLVNKWGAAIEDFYKDPDSALALIESSPSYVNNGEGRCRAVNAEEAGKLFETEGIRVINIYAVCRWLDMLPIPKKVIESSNWDERFFRQATEMVLKLSKEPSVSGMSRHLVVYGERIKE